jgi:NadR type nicotinamide-nucleotide adenylyltransferase
MSAPAADERARAAPLRIVLAGPESSGKSLLTEHLARRFRVPFALEYARYYLETHGAAYDYDLLLPMSRQHLAYQRLHVPESAPLGVLDTDLINYKIWCEVAYGRCHPEIVEAMERETNHVYLLCAPDLPWQYDPLREHPRARDMLFDRHVRELERLGRPYEVVRGEKEAHFACAEAAFRRLAGWRDQAPPAPGAAGGTAPPPA